MKKTLAVLAVLLFALATVSATQKGEIVAGADFGYVIQKVGVKGSESVMNVKDIKLDAFGQYWITEDFGVYAEVGVSKTASLRTSDDPDVEMMDVGDSKAVLAFTVGGTYSYEIQKGLDLVAGFGVGRRGFTIAQSISERRYHYLVLEATAAASYELDEKNGLDVYGGLKCDMLVGKLTHQTYVDGHTVGAGFEKDGSGFGVTPFIGVTKSF